jgi:hypothetical protein
MTTLQALIDRCEDALSDIGNAMWAAADIEQWCRDAIGDYSEHFLLTETESIINCAAGDRRYDLDSLFVQMLTVEYPAGEDPPRFMQRRPNEHPAFWREDGYYDVVDHHDGSDAAELLISSRPSTGESISVCYQRRYDHTIARSAAIEVPATHEHILVDYVLWRGALQLKAIEEASPTSNSSLLMSQLAINVDRARRAYVDALAKALFATSRSAVVSWADQDEATRRIY